MLFTKEITKITFEDVSNFCNEQIRESINLDYKKDFPNDLEKTIAAFANTMGGLIIIGVDESDGKPKLPVEGLEYKEGLSERITNIILSNIYPPIFPEIQVCEPVRNKTFVIIRVPQSNITPHFIRHRTQIYIRTNDISHPEELASAEQMEWLRDKRKQSEELREILLNNAQERYSNYLTLYKSPGIPFGEMTLSILPLYPSTLYKTYREIKQIADEIKAKGYGHEFPYLFSEARSVENGAVQFFYSKDTKYIEYTELNQFGLLYYKKDIGYQKEEKSGDKTEKIKEIHLSDIITCVDLFLEASTNFYEKLGYWGLVKLRLSLEKLLGIKLIGIKEELFPEKENISVDNKLNKERVYYVNDIKKKRIELLIELIQDIGWSLGWDYIAEDKIKKFLETKNPLLL